MLDFLTNGVGHFSASGIVLYTYLTTLMTIITVTVGYHRYWSHGALKLHPAIEWVFRFWGWLSTGMIPKVWAAIHRAHHAFQDTMRDPHSPIFYGMWGWKGVWKRFRGVVLANTELYQKAAEDDALIHRHGKGVLLHPFFDASWNRYTGLGILFVIDFTLFGAIGLTVWAIQMICIPLLGGVINGLGHSSKSEDEKAGFARNIFPWGLIIGGEEWHKNHHTYPGSAKLGHKWWQIDIGYYVITLLKWFRLAWDVKTPATA